MYSVEDETTIINWRPARLSSFRKQILYQVPCLIRQFFVLPLESLRRQRTFYGINVTKFSIQEKSSFETEPNRRYTNLLLQYALREDLDGRTS